jgi:hypothetical protein
MKSERPRFPRSAQRVERGNAGPLDRLLPESKCPSCGQMVNTRMHQSFERDKSVIAFPSPMSGKVDGKQRSIATDLERVLHFSQQLYAHALTLQEFIRNEGELRYEVLRPRYDRQAAQQFDIFYRALGRFSELPKPAARAGE